MARWARIAVFDAPAPAVDTVSSESYFDWLGLSRSVTLGQPLEFLYPLGKVFQSALRDPIRMRSSRKVLFAHNFLNGPPFGTPCQFRTPLAAIFV